MMATLKPCSWAPRDDALYADYHDNEWGVPERDPRALWEKLVLDGFQAGLSWRTILYKRDNFRAAFKNFDPEKVARFGKRDINRLLKDEGIIRHRGKIDATIKGAQIWLDMMERGEDFADFIWAYVDHEPLQPKRQKMKDIPAKTALSEQIAKDLKKRGFNFCGPTIVYAFMQAVGMVNDHIVTCPQHKKVAKLA